VSADRPDRPGVAALVAELEVRRHVRTGLLVGGGFAIAVFALFAYLPGTQESLLYWVALTFVLGSAVSGLVTTGLIAQAAYQRTLAVNDLESAGPSSTTLAVVVGLLGWVLVPVAATLAFDEVTGGLAIALGRTTAPGPAGGLTLLVSVVTGAFAVVTIGGLGVGLVSALSLVRARRRADRWVPPLTTAVFDDIGLRVGADGTLAVHDASHGGLAATLAEMVTGDTGADVTLDGAGTPAHRLFHEQPGRVVVETTDPGAGEDAFDGVAPVQRIGTADDSGSLSLTADDETLHYGAEAIADLRDVIERELDG
jgi:hypothetical protein